MFSTLDPEWSKPKKGLYGKYLIKHSDGSDTDPNAIYFVLRLDGHCKNSNFIAACRAAARQFASEARDKGMSEIGNDLDELIDDLEIQELK